MNALLFLSGDYEWGDVCKIEDCMRGWKRNKGVQRLTNTAAGLVFCYCRQCGCFCCVYVRQALWRTNLVWTFLRRDEALIITACFLSNGERTK